MGEKNNVFKVYMNRSDRIRSVLEYHLGQKLPADWLLHCTEESGFYSVVTRRGKISFRQRDIFKKVSIGGAEYYLGIENQEKINLTIPWRIMQMDCLEYERQLEEIQQRNISQKVSYDKADDYMYKLRREDRLVPILSLVLYWGKQEWKKPHRLKDMLQMELLSEDVEEKIVDYPVHIIEMRSIPEEALEEMDSDLKYVLGIMKYAGKGKKYQEYINEHQEYFKRIPKSAVDVLDVCMNIRDIKKYLVYEEDGGEEKTDMCKAIREIKEEGKKEGRKVGRKEGRKEGEQRLALLIQKLIEAGKSEIIGKVAVNPEFRAQLFEEYGIQ